MARPVLEVRDLTKTYGKETAVDRISFSMQKGEVLGLLGPNGAGKTTTIQMLLGLLSSEAGEIKYFGKDFAKNEEYCLARINFASAYSRLQNKLTIRQNLRIFSELYGIDNPLEKIEELAKQLRIDHMLDRMYWQLSSGERTRTHLAKCLINEPDIILMDEPTASLDPEIRNEVLDLIKDLQQRRQVSVLYTSHDMAEVSRICDRVMFLSKGKIVAEDTPLELTKLIGDARLTLTYEGAQRSARAYFKEKAIEHKFISTHLVEVRIAEERIPKVLFGLSKRGIHIAHIAIDKPDLEDVFLSIAREK